MKKAEFDTGVENGYSLQAPPLYNSVSSVPDKTEDHTPNASICPIRLAPNESQGDPILKNVDELPLAQEVGLIFSTLSTYTLKLPAL